MFMALMAAFKVLLMRYSGEEDLSVGTVIANRTRKEIEGLIGVFINTLVMRTDLGGNPSFRELIAREREVALGAYMHQEAPFEKLVEEINPQRNLSRSPLFQALMILQNAGQVELELSGLELSGIDREDGLVRFDLSLMLTEGKDGIAGGLIYSRDIYEGETIRRMARHYERVVEEVVKDAERQIREIELMSESEREQIIVEFNRTQREYRKEQCLHELIEAQVERSRRQTAVVYEEEALTYGELNAHANQLARYLRKLGVGPEVLVGLFVERSIEMVVGLLGILKAGGAYVPLDPSYPLERLTFMLEDSRASVLLTQERLLPFLPASGMLVICLDRDFGEIRSESVENLKSDVSLANPAYVIYTSGSTGRPKGVVISHGAILNHMLWMQEAFPLDERDRVMQKTPFSFDASVWEFYAPLLVGGQLIVARPDGHLESAYLVRLIVEREVAILQVVPSMLRMLLAEAEIEGCRSLRRVFCGGEALTPDLRDRFFLRLPAELHNLYGPTEATIDAISWGCLRGENFARDVVPIGRPIANAEAYVLDERLEPVPVGIWGELYLGGLGIGRGYLRRPEMTAERFIPHRFTSGLGERLYRTGDLVRYLPDGNLDFLSRMDNQIKFKGYRIELGEIERVLEQAPWVQEAVAVVREDDSGDKRLVAYVVGEDEKEEDTARLRKYMSEKLPHYMVPAVFVSLETMPLSPNGKIDRRRLPAPHDTECRVAQNYVAPRTPLESTLVEIWQEVMGVKRVGIRDDFFELGGHSLLAVQIVSRLHNSLLIDFPLRAMFESLTVEQLAIAVEQLLAQEVVELSEDEALQLLGQEG